MAPPPSLQELIAVIRQDSPTDDPLDLLATASTTVTDLSTVGDSVLDHFVAGARRDGRSWAEISSVLGVSKQAAHKRFSPSIQLSPSGNFERMTPRARKTVEAAVEIARGLGHHYVGTEHVLLGQFAEPEAVAARVLATHGLTSANVTEKLLAITPNGAPISDDSQPPFTPRAKQLLSGAVAEALKLGHNYIGTEHILLALFHDGESLAAKIIDELGLTAVQARQGVVAVLSEIVAQKNRDKGSPA
jgi:hypothetical protein